MTITLPCPESTTSRGRRVRAAVAVLVVAATSALLAGCGASSGADPAPQPREWEGRTLQLFVGSASQPPTERAAQAFEERTGARLEVHFGGSGEMLARLKLSGRGDIYFPGSSDYLEIAKRDGLVDPASETVVAYLVPAINVPRGNPKAIRTLADLAQPGVRVAIARPDTVCVGLYAVEVLENSGLAERVRPNIVTNTESCAKTAQIIALGHVDAVIGWEVFEHWDPQRIETVLLPADLIPRIGYLPVAIATTSREPELARAFIDFLAGPDGQAIFAERNYLTSVDAARRLTRDDAPVGGEWPLPDGW